MKAPRTPAKALAAVLGTGAVWWGAAQAVNPPSVGARTVADGPPAALLPTGDGIDHSALDVQVSPCSDFYRHACGGFLASHPATAEQPVISLAQSQFDADLQQGLERLFREQARQGSELDRLQTFYASCKTGTRSDVALVRFWLDRIEAAKDQRAVQAVMRDLARIGVNAFIMYDGRPDRARPDRYRGEIHNGTVWADAEVVQRTFEAAGKRTGSARRDAAAVVAITSALRKHVGERWDGSTAENPRSLAQLRQLAPQFEWNSYLRMVGSRPGVPINVTSPDYLQTVGQELSSRSPAQLRAYLRWVFLLSLRGELPSPFTRAFGDLPPNLRPEMHDPNVRCRDATVRAMGVEFSRQYSTHILGLPARNAATALSETIKNQIVESVQSADWLSPDARRATAAKLRQTDLKIGFPDIWPSVGHYTLHRDRFLQNVLEARRFEQRREWVRARQPRVRTHWEMKVDPWVGEGMAAARLVLPNGFPDAFSNSLIMTAAFLASPRFESTAPAELNYATYGSVFAHEFVHVAQLHMFGPTGRDEELWTPSDEKAADQRGQCVIDQADSYYPLPGLALPGKDEFDENVADYGGLRLAYEALKHSLGESIYKRDSTGTSPAQRFFYRYAQSHCSSQTDASLRQSVENDPHAPEGFRVNGPISNTPGFARAFSCPMKAPMVRAASKQCQVW